MTRRWPLATSFCVLLSLLIAQAFAGEKLPRSAKIENISRIKQITNYCGPACVASVLNHLGREDTQETVGKVIYDAGSGATSGADMLLYARDKGFSAYSWNSNTRDLKAKLAAGFPVIVLQQNSIIDTSGHYRVVTGYDDATSTFRVMDPYYDEITSLTYSRFDQLWRTKGCWSLVVVPPDKDTFKADLDTRNPVVHMDLSYALYKRQDYDKAMEEAKTALALAPGNSYTVSMVNKIKVAMGAGK